MTFPYLRRRADRGCHHRRRAPASAPHSLPVPSAFLAPSNAPASVPSKGTRLYAPDDARWQHLIAGWWRYFSTTCVGWRPMAALSRRNDNPRTGSTATRRSKPAVMQDPPERASMGANISAASAPQSRYTRVKAVLGAAAGDSPPGCPPMGPCMPGSLHPSGNEASAATARTRNRDFL
jgi:hypothetical protein